MQQANIVVAMAVPAVVIERSAVADEEGEPVPWKHQVGVPRHFLILQAKS
jgi:hypothetical protein